MCAIPADDSNRGPCTKKPFSLNGVAGFRWTASSARSDFGDI
jgi:hypothetical protein